MAGKAGTEMTTGLVKKHETVINAMTESEKKAAIAEQLESVEVNVKQKAFYQAKEVAFAHQRKTGILAVEAARNKAKSDGEDLLQAWKDAEATGVWDLPVK